MSVNDFYRSPFSKNITYSDAGEEGDYLRAVCSSFCIAQSCLRYKDEDGTTEALEKQAADVFSEYCRRLKSLFQQGWRLVPMPCPDLMKKNREKKRMKILPDENIYHVPFDDSCFQENIHESMAAFHTQANQWNDRFIPALINSRLGLALYSRFSIRNVNCVFFMVPQNNLRIINYFTGKLYSLGDDHYYGIMNPACLKYSMKASTQKYAESWFYSDAAADSLEAVLTALYGFPIKWNSNLENYLKIRAYFGNLTEALLRQTKRAPWLVTVMAEGLRWGKPCGAKSLKAFFNVTQSELEMFLDRGDEKFLMFYLIVRQQEHLSVTEAKRLYDKVDRMNTDFRLDEQYNDHQYRYSWSKRKRISVKGRHGRQIMTTENLPEYLWFYLDHKLNRYYSVSRYTKYVVEEKKLYPDMSMDDFEQKLDDYNRMAAEILGENTKFILPYKLAHAHQTMVDNYNNILHHDESGARCMDSPENVQKLDRYYNDDLYIYDDPRFVVLRPMIPSDIYREGTVLCHCVGSYTSRVLDGDTKILFMRKKSKPNEPYVTFELRNDNTIPQQYGSHDRYTTEEEKDFINRWHKSYLQKYEAWKEAGSPVKTSDRYKTFQKKYEEHLVQLRKELDSIQTVDSDISTKSKKGNRAKA